MAPPILALRDVRLADGPRWLFDGVDLALETRARACLVGRNGAGKSTLLRIMAGTTAADSGDRFITPGVKVVLVGQEPTVFGATLRDYATAGGAAAHLAEAASTIFSWKVPTGTATFLPQRSAMSVTFNGLPFCVMMVVASNM